MHGIAIKGNNVYNLNLINIWKR